MQAAETIFQKQSAREITAGWRFRPATLDRAVFNDVIFENEYRLPSRFAPDDIVLDVGAHIGSFAYAALLRGCQKVFSVEPDRANCEIALENLRDYVEQSRVTIEHGAVWRSDPNDDVLLFDGYHPFPKSFAGTEGILNTANGSVIWGVGERVPKIAFDELVDQLPNAGEKRIRLLKLDCEGSEWPILFTSQRLHLVDEICGEFHEIGGDFLEISEDRDVQQPVFHTADEKFTLERLVAFLNAAGFEVTTRRHRRPDGAKEGLGLFFARRLLLDSSQPGPSAQHS
jgi:FkbM family methyltransferase